MRRQYTPAFGCNNRNITVHKNKTFVCSDLIYKPETKNDFKQRKYIGFN